MVKKLIYLLTFLGVLASIPNANSDDTTYNGYKIAFCKNCTSDEIFLLYAESLNSGLYLVVNAEASLARAVRVVLGQSRDGLGTPVTRAAFVTPPSNLPLILAEMEELNQAFDDVLNSGFGSQSFNGSHGSLTEEYYRKLTTFQNNSGLSSAGNGCGTPTHVSYWFIRSVEYPFNEACNDHDACYELSVASKKQCDDQFFVDMMDKISSYDWLTLLDFSNITSLLIAVKVAKEIHVLKAKKAYDIVANNPAALAAFCIDKDSSFPECNPNSMPGGAGEFHSDSGTILSAGSWTFVQTCELWRFPDGNNGYYYLDLNCRFMQIP